MTPEQYDAYQEYRPERDDDTPQYPYQGFYDGDGSSRKRRKSGGHGGWWILVIVALVAAGVIGFFSRYSMEIRQTSNGYTLSIQDGRDKTPESPVPDEGEKVLNQTGPTVQVPAAVVGSGTELTLTETPASPEMPGDAGLTLQQIYKKVIPSVVSITSTTYSGVASGTGIIMSSDGYIITNAHVIDDASKLVVILAGGEEVEATLVGKDETTDLALLKIEKDGLTAINLGNSDEVRVGETVLAIGNPMGQELYGSVSKGIISATNRQITMDSQVYTMLQTDTAINPGNSGGALVITKGELIGICSVKTISTGTDSNGNSISAEGLGFAIPINEAMPIIEELKEKGYVERPVLGVTGGFLTEQGAAYYRCPVGFVVQQVSAGGGAEAAGIQSMDVITAIDGQELASYAEMSQAITSHEIGDTVTVTVWRNGETLDLNVTLGASGNTSETTPTTTPAEVR